MNRSRLVRVNVVRMKKMRKVRVVFEVRRWEDESVVLLLLLVLGAREERRNRIGEVERLVGCRSVGISDFDVRVVRGSKWSAG